MGGFKHDRKIYRCIPVMLENWTDVLKYPGKGFINKKKRVHKGEKWTILRCTLWINIKYWTSVHLWYTVTYRINTCYKCMLNCLRYTDIDPSVCMDCVIFVTVAVI